MCFHKWKEYKDLDDNRYYNYRRICIKCGIAQRGEYDVLSNRILYATDETLCRTNNWISRDIYELKYNK